VSAVERGAKPLGTTYTKVMPPLSTEEKEKLAASIAAEGVRVPILVDEDGEIIEGGHRYEIEPECPRILIAGLKTPAEKKAAAIRLNVARRNMTPEQGEELALTQRDVALELLSEGNTQEQIAAKLGVSRPTVTRWIAAATEGNDVRANNVSQEEDRPKPDWRAKLGPKDRGGGARDRRRLGRPDLHRPALLPGVDPAVRRPRGVRGARARAGRQPDRVRRQLRADRRGAAAAAAPDLLVD
jgi:ParB-like chromosome segregation protein Spo0J